MGLLDSIEPLLDFVDETDGMEWITAALSETAEIDTSHMVVASVLAQHPYVSRLCGAPVSAGTSADANGESFPFKNFAAESILVRPHSPTAGDAQVRGCFS